MKDEVKQYYMCFTDVQVFLTKVLFTGFKNNSTDFGEILFLILVFSFLVFPVDLICCQGNTFYQDHIYRALWRH